MTTPDHDRVEELFLAALELEPGKRAAFLDQACGRDETLLSEVRALLAAHEQAGGFIETPAAELLAGLGRDQRASSRLERRVGSFRLSKVIGSGGMGTVYEAIQEHPSRTVALKMMRTGLTSRSAVRRFQYEVEILARLHHPFVAQVYEAGVHEEDERTVPYFAMEYIPGARTILEHAEAIALGTRERLELLAKICDAVQHAHEKGVIHRDLKPTNLLVDSNGVPKVIDFGVALATDPEMALTTLGAEVSRVVGTVQYMSPEAFTGDPHGLDTRSDVYSLGVVLFELLTGRLPHSLGTTSLAEAARVVQTEPPSRPSRIRRELGGDLETIMLKALAKERDRRYASMADLGRDLGRYLRNEPIEARPPSASYHFRKLVARHKAVSALLAALVVAVAAFGIVMAILAERAREEAATAEQATTFMQELFAQAAPNRSLGEEIPVRLVLDQAARRIRGELEGAPAVRARLLYSLGLSYSWLGSYEKAERLLREALVLRTRLAGSDDALALQIQQELAGELLNRGAPAEAEQLLRATLARQRRKLGPRHNNVAECTSSLGTALWKLGRAEEAEQSLRSAVGILGQNEESGLPRARCLNRLAGFLHETERNEEALPLFEETLAIYQRVFPKGHPLIPVYRHNLARCLTALGDGERALEQSQQALIETGRLCGEEHPEYAGVLAGVADSFVSLGRFDQAVPHLRRALEIQERLLGPDHRWTILTCNDLGNALRELGRYGEGRTFLRRAVDAYRQVHPEGHPDLAVAISNLAGTLGSLGELQEAEGLAREALRMQRAVEPGDTPSIGTTLAVLGLVLLNQGRLNDAEAAYTEAVSILDRWPAAGMELASAHIRLALINNLRGEAQLAEQQASTALECIQRSVPGDHPYAAFAVYHLGWARLQQGDTQGAEANFRESIAMFRLTFVEGHPDLVWPLDHLGKVLLYRSTGEAVELFEQALELRRRFRSSPHWLSVSLNNLAAAYHLDGESEGALPLVEEAIQIRSQGFPASDQDLANARFLAGAIQAQLGDYEGAAAHAADFLEQQRRLYPPGHSIPANTESLLGEMKARLSQFAEAERLLLDCYEALEKDPAEAKSTEATARSLVLLYELWGRPEQAAAFRAQLAGGGEH